MPATGRRYGRTGGSGVSLGHEPPVSPVEDFGPPESDFPNSDPEPTRLRISPPMPSKLADKALASAWPASFASSANSGSRTLAVTMAGAAAGSGSAAGRLLLVVGSHPPAQRAEPLGDVVPGLLGLRHLPHLFLGFLGFLGFRGFLGFLGFRGLFPNLLGLLGRPARTSWG